jgi:hypothetical protein
VILKLKKKIQIESRFQEKIKNMLSALHTQYCIIFKISQRFSLKQHATKKKKKKGSKPNNKGAQQTLG